MDILIDTNIFYEYYDRRNLDEPCSSKVNHIRLNSILNNPSNTIALGSVSIIEIMSKFRNKPDAIQDMIRFMLKKNIRCYFQGIYDFSENDLIMITKCKPYIVKKIASDYLKMKIEIEAEVGIAFCCFVLQFYLDFFFAREEMANNNFSNINQKEKLRLKAYIQKSLLNDKLSTHIEKEERGLRQKLRKGYATEKSNKVAKVPFNDFLTKYLILTSVYARAMVDNYVIGLSDNEIENIVMDMIEKNFDSATFFEFHKHAVLALSKVQKDYRKKCNEDFFSVMSEKMKRPWIESKQFSNLQVEYVMQLYKNWCKDRIKIEKNDVLDFFILGSIKDDYFLTLDKRLVTFLDTQQHKSINLINRIKAKK